MPQMLYRPRGCALPQTAAQANRAEPSGRENLTLTATRRSLSALAERDNTRSQREEPLSAKAERGGPRKRAGVRFFPAGRDALPFTRSICGPRFLFPNTA